MMWLGNAVSAGSTENPLSSETYKAVEFSPNGNPNWQKEHSTTLTIPDLADKLTSAKYCWTNSQTQPAESAFTETFSNGDTITHNGVTGTYYVWCLLETIDGEKVYCRSEGFNFDNACPTINSLTSTAITYSSFKLSLSAIDQNSGITQYEFFVDGVSQGVQTVNNTTASFSQELTVTNAAYGNTSCYVIVTDTLGNSSRKDITAQTLMDTTAPSITSFTATKSSATAITLSVTANDTGIGLTKFEFYIDGTLQSSYTQTFTATTSSVTKTVTITGLSTGSHTCKVIAYDAKNNSSNSSVSGSTKLYTWTKWSINKTSTYTKTSTSAGTKTYPRTSYASLTSSMSFDSSNGYYCLAQACSSQYICSFSSGWIASTGSVTKAKTVCCVSGRTTKYCSMFPSVVEGYTYQVTKWSSTEKVTETKGTTQYSDITSTSSTAYPSNGTSGSYWYVYKGVY